MTTSSPPKLYNSVICPYAHRAFIALEELGVSYDYVEFDLVQHYYTKPEWFLQLNPMGKVPVLVHEGKNIQESLVVVEYLDEVFGGGKTLFPVDKYKRAQAKIWTNYYMDFISPLYYKILGEADPAKVKELIVQFNEKLKFLSKHGLQANQDTSKQGQQYFLGNQFSYVDIALVPFLLRAKITLNHYKKVDLFNGAKEDEDIKKLKSWFDFAAQRKSVQETSYLWNRFDVQVPNAAFSKLGYKEQLDFNFEQLINSVYEKFAKTTNEV